MSDNYVHVFRTTFTRKDRKSSSVERTCVLGKREGIDAFGKGVVPVGDLNSTVEKIRMNARYGTHRVGLNAHLSRFLPRATRVRR
ncbi:hypothetical protein OKW30_004637 [Paraburkholderia sp. Clong3]|uniref:hypothetical protein n=1 Tax=Paraburkholderia sp. Clong3 TaxID=2991061 RepID=UPI003D1C0E9B